MGDYKEDFKTNAKVMKAGVSELARVIHENSREKRKLLSILNDMVDTAGKNVGRLQDAQDTFLRIMKQELGCK